METKAGIGCSLVPDWYDTFNREILENPPMMLRHLNVIVQTLKRRPALAVFNKNPYFMVHFLIIFICVFATVKAEDTRQTNRENSATKPRIGDDHSQLVRILYWTDYNNKSIKSFMPEDFSRTGCKVSQCEIITDKNLYEDSDYVVFSSSDMPRLPTESLPTKRFPHQKWIYLNRETPPHTAVDIMIIRDMFNLTMSYRPNSDIYAPYGYTTYTKSRTDTTGSEKNYAAGKKKLAFWLASSCSTYSRRESLVDTLQHYIPFDTYGTCGTYECPKVKDTECWDKFEKEYKFAFAFESTICRHYAGERVWTPLQRNIVPVVLGGALYRHILPPNSFIDINDFQSIRHLTNYLVYLDGNDTAYNQYFEWKDKYHIHIVDVASHHCLLCTYAHLQTAAASRPTPCLYDWQHITKECAFFNKDRKVRYEDITQAKEQIFREDLYSLKG